MNQEVLVFETEEEWVSGAAREIAARLRVAIAARRRATLLLSGGSTPAPVYRALSQTERMDWAAVHFFWGDERMVPPDDSESNFRMARETLLEPLGIPLDDARVHRFPTEGAARENAAMYEQNLRLFFGVAQGEAPVFDVVLLGMGDDGHTASLFPETEALGEEARLTAANVVPAQGTTRLTVTYPVLNAARTVFVLVKGEKKAGILAEVFDGGDEGKYPVQGVRPEQGELVWVLDAGAAREIMKNYLKAPLGEKEK
jgi:6-phosphogluconolactonase